MKYYPLVLVLVAFALFTTCKKDSNNDPLDAEEVRPLYEVMQTLGSLEATVLELSRNGIDNAEVLAQAASIVENRPEVSEVLVADEFYAFITMASGLSAGYTLIPVDGSGKPITRGGATGGGDIFEKLAGGDCTNDIDNRKILLFNADLFFETEFSTKKVIQDKALKYGIELTSLRGKECTYEKLNTFSDYGLVVINTHGAPNGFLMGDTVPQSIQDSTVSLEEFAKRVNADQDRRITDLLQLDLQLSIVKHKKFEPNVPIHQTTFDDADSYKMYVKAKYIAQLNLPETIVFGNMCYSGYSNTSRIALDDLPILSAWQQANVRAYYGYQGAAGVSRSVSNDFATQMELKFYQALFNDGDSSGVAHLDAMGSECADTFIRQYDKKWFNIYGDLFCRQFFADDYCYQVEPGCEDTIFTDSRDSKVYRTICIGDRRWMAENLRYNSTGSICFDNDPARCETEGRLYTYRSLVGNITDNCGSVVNPLQGNCPNGWRLPSRTDWDLLIAAAGGIDGAGRVLKSTTTWLSGAGIDSLGFNVKPAGVVFIDNQGVPDFSNFGSNTQFHSCESVGTGSNGNIEVRYINIFRTQDRASLSAQEVETPAGAWAFSCRCVQDL